MLGDHGKWTLGGGLAHSVDLQGGTARCIESQPYDSTQLDGEYIQIQVRMIQMVGVASPI